MRYRTRVNRTQIFGNNDTPIMRYTRKRMTKAEAIAYIQGKIDLPDEVIEALRDNKKRKTIQMLSRQFVIIILMVLCTILGFVIGRSFVGSEKEKEKAETEVEEQYDPNEYRIDELEREVSELYNKLLDLEKEVTVTNGEAAYAKSAVDTLKDYLKERLEE